MNRQSRALLTILVVGVLFVPYYVYSRREPAPAPAASAADSPARGGALVASTRTDPRSFNRLVHAQIATELFSLLTQGRLVRINRATFEVEPWLAERWQTSADGRTFTLSLRDGLSWSDGAPFTSADVVFTFQALYDPRTASPLVSALTIGGQPVSVSAPDPRTVVVTYAAAFGPGVRALDLVPIFPKHRLEGSLKDGTFAKAWPADLSPSELVSLGPFVLTQYQPAQRMVFERNPRFWRRDDRGIELPYADRVTIEIVPDQDAEIVRLQAGQTDFMQQALRSSDVETLRPLEARGQVQIVELGVSLDVDHFLFNLRPGKWAKDPRASWLTRRELRQAISHGVDREALANTVFLGAAVPVHGPVSPGNQRWFWPSIPRYPYDVTKARGLLTSIGLTNRDQDEWVEDAQGNEARFTLLTFRGNTTLERGATVLRDDLRRLGIAVDVVALEPNTVQQRILDGDFETALIQFTASDPDPAMSKDFWLSSGSAHFWNPAQPSPATEWERQIDDLMTRQAATVDEAERRRLFNDVQRIFSEQLPIINFAAPRIYIGTSARLMNLAPALARPPLTWSVDTLAIRGAAGATP